MTGRRLLVRDDADPAAVGLVLRVLYHAVQNAVRNGGVAAADPLARALIHELYDATGQQPAAAVTSAERPVPASENGSVPSGPSRVELTAGEAAEVMGCSARWVRQLVREGRVRGRRAGHVWLIDAADLDRYRHGRTAA